MTQIPTQVTEAHFQQSIEPHLSTAQRGYVSDQPLYMIFNYILYKLYTGCPWPALPIPQTTTGEPVMSYQVPYYHFRKWSQDGRLQRLVDASIVAVRGVLNLSELNLDGSHSAAIKGAKTLPITAARRRSRATSCR